MLSMDPDSVWFSFWIPDGAPAGSVQTSGFYMYPDAFKDPPVSDPRTVVSVNVCLEEALRQGGCVSPDRQLMNMVNLQAYMVAHRLPQGVVINPAEPARLLEGTTAMIENVDGIVRLGGENYYFGRAGCDGQSCAAHFEFHCPIHDPYPPYKVCVGDFEIKRFGVQAFVTFIGLNEQRTLAMAEMMTEILDHWSQSRD